MIRLIAGPCQHENLELSSEIAQECKDIIPEVVKFHADEDTPNENGWASAYGLDYGQLTPLLINAIKELSAKNDALEARLAAFEGS